jgi:hypothetical protein
LLAKYSLESLEEFIVGFLQSNLSDTVKQSEFLQMKAGKFHALLSKGSMLKLKPEIKLFLVISWVGFEVQAREKYLVLLLRHICVYSCIMLHGSSCCADSSHSNKFISFG